MKITYTNLKYIISKLILCKCINRFQYDFLFPFLLFIYRFFLLQVHLMSIYLYTIFLKNLAMKNLQILNTPKVGNYESSDNHNAKLM